MITRIRLEIAIRRYLSRPDFLPYVILTDDAETECAVWWNGR